MKALNDFFLKKTILVGVYVHSEQTFYRVISVLKKKEDLEILSRYEFDNLQSLNEYLSSVKNLPVKIYIDGDITITRKGEYSPGYEQELLFNSNIEEYYSIEYIVESEVFLSFGRKKAIQTIVESIAVKDNLLGFYFGPLMVLPLAKALSINRQIYSSFYKLNFSEGKLLAIEKGVNDDFVYKIDEEKLSIYEIPLLGTYLYKPQITISLNYNSDEQQENFVYDKLYKKSIVIGAIFLLVVLLTGHLLLDFYSGVLRSAEVSYSQVNKNLEIENTLKKEKQDKIKIMEGSGVKINNFLTKYFLDLGNRKTKGLTINEINCFPLLNRIDDEDHKIKNDFSKIILKGNSSNEEALNSYMKAIEKLNWVNKLYLTSSVKENKQHNFIIELSL